MMTEYRPDAGPFRAKRRRAEALGRAAEGEAAALYEAEGYTVLARRARSGAGEIDLVVADAATLVFVEVKRRRTILAATEALQPRQRQRIISAAAILLAHNAEWQRPDTRFDLIMATEGEIHRLADAFRAD